MTRHQPSPAIRSALPGDAAEIARIKVAGWRFAYRGLLPADLLAGLDVRKTTSQWRRIIEQNTGSLAIPRVAYLQPSPIIGFLQASPVEDGGTRVNTLYLDPMHVGNGWELTDETRREHMGRAVLRESRMHLRLGN